MEKSSFVRLFRFSRSGGLPKYRNPKDSFGRSGRLPKIRCFEERENSKICSGILLCSEERENSKIRSDVLPCSEEWENSKILRVDFCVPKNGKIPKIRSGGLPKNGKPRNQDS
ncbi:unnamed protein product [Rhizophagus irregularis]|nr:unnamed protein product [Rhizophagus irregularis]